MTQPRGEDAPGGDLAGERVHGERLGAVLRVECARPGVDQNPPAHGRQLRYCAKAREVGGPRTRGGLDLDGDEFPAALEQEVDFDGSREGAQ